MTPEAKVKKEVRKILDEYGAWHCMPMGSGFGRSGVPDLLVCYLGTFIAIECKAGDNRPTLLQERELERIKKAGGYSLLVNEANLGYLRQLLEKIKECPQ